MMGMKYLSKTGLIESEPDDHGHINKSIDEPRINLWRKVVFQLRKTSRNVGFLSSIGNTSYLIEKKIIRMGREWKIDIISWNPETDNSTPVLLELTMNVKDDKKKQIDSYRMIKPDDLRPIGVSMTDPLEIIIACDQPYDYCSDCCKIVFGDTLHAENTDKISNNELKKAVEKSEGLDLIHIPSTSFTIVPESKYGELRRGACGSIISKFSNNCDSFSSEDVVNECLDFIKEHIEFSERKDLINRMESQIDILVNGILSDYLYKENSLYKKTEKGKTANSNTQSLAAISKYIESWASTRTLESFSK